MAKETLMKERESKTDIAYRLMLKKKKERNFYELWEDVKAELAKVAAPEELENIEEDISFFYTNLTLDGRFVCVGENKWNLRERVTFDKVHIDMNEIYAEEEEIISEDEDSKDELYYKLKVIVLELLLYSYNEDIYISFHFLPLLYFLHKF